MRSGHLSVAELERLLTAMNGGKPVSDPAWVDGTCSNSRVRRSEVPRHEVFRVMQEADTLGPGSQILACILVTAVSMQQRLVKSSSLPFRGDRVIHRAELLGAISAWRPAADLKRTVGTCKCRCFRRGLRGRAGASCARYGNVDRKAGGSSAVQLLPSGWKPVPQDTDLPSLLREALARTIQDAGMEHCSNASVHVVFQQMP